MFQNKQRYLDELNRAMLITALVLTIIDLFFFQFGTWPRYVLSAVSATLLILLVLRMTSRNQNARYRENMKFLTVVNSVRGWFSKTFRRSGASGAGYAPRAKKAKKAKKNPTWSEMREYKYLICPQCTQRLRVPRGKGRIRVTCTNCGNVFETKS